MSTNWNWNGNPKRNPLGDVPSALTACPYGLLVAYSDGLANWYEQRGYKVFPTGGEQPGLCVYPGQDMVGGIAGQSQYGYYTS